MRKRVQDAKNDITQIRNFYEADETVLWVTFFGDRLYWCFSNPEITLLSDKTKTRPVVGHWRSTDVNGQPLDKGRLSGKLLSMQGFCGTICSVKEFDYLVHKINGELTKDNEEATEAVSALEQKIEKLVRQLHWKDFEILIDMIFRQAGWQRIGGVGEAEKTIDLDLLSPITSERYAVQVKSKANLAEFQDYQDAFADMQGYRRLYFVVHTPSAELESHAEDQLDDDFQVWLPQQVTRLAVRYGLVEWIIGKTA